MIRVVAAICLVSMECWNGILRGGGVHPPSVRSSNDTAQLSHPLARLDPISWRHGRPTLRLDPLMDWL